MTVSLELRRFIRPHDERDDPPNRAQKAAEKTANSRLVVATQDGRPDDAGDEPEEHKLHENPPSEAARAAQPARGEDKHRQTPQRQPTVAAKSDTP